MAGQTCARCGAEAEVVISRIEDGTPVSLSYCDGCWRVVRYAAGPIMSEGPATWGHDWAEVEEWLARNLRQVAAGADSGAWRRLIAHDLRAQMSHLPADVPQSVSTFLASVGDDAG